MNFNLLKIGVVLFAAATLSACKKEEPVDPDTPGSGLVIKLNNYLMAVDGRENARPFNLSTSQPWKVVLTDEQKTWITVTPDAGEGNFKATKISVRASENSLSKLPRETEIKFIMIGNDTPEGTATLKVTQGTEYFMKKDSLAMVALYNATDGPNWTKKWDLSLPIAQWGFYGQGNIGADKHYWNGVYVAKDATNSRRIDRLGLFEPFGMRGKLPEEMRDLTGMRMFELCGFKLEGQTFAEFMDVMYEWNALQFFWLTGGCEMGKALVPTGLGNFRALWGINFTDHDFIGFEEDFGTIDFPELNGFVIANGLLEGEFKPEYVDKMPKLAGLSIPNNNLTGSVSPKIIMGKPNLLMMELYGNRFTGVFPSNIRNSPTWSGMEGIDGPASDSFCPQQPGYKFDAGTCD